MIKININEVKNIWKRLNKKNILITIVAIILLIVVFTHDDKEIDTNNNQIVNNDVVISEKQIKKYSASKLLSMLNYSDEDIDIICSRFNEEDIKEYLVSKKYNNLVSFMDSDYFNIENINRYQNYYDKYKYDEVKTVLYVEIGLDNEFYTNIRNSNIDDGKLILVNKYNYVDENYDASLVSVDKEYGSGQMNEEAYKYFKKMVDSAKKDNIILKGISIYRSYNTQKEIYEGYVSRDSQKNADTYSARAGHSEHQTGLAVDINTASSSSHFENTKEYEWLINNSYKYGFILRYPEGKTFITGYKYEPWHYRYIGVSDATKLYNEDITYEEYYFKYLENSY